jgi:LPLT family lysophospholipid transporter-like MFS transporter
MPFGFYIIMAAQFFSALADNALLIVAISALREMHAPSAYEPLLKTFFTVSYVAWQPLSVPSPTRCRSGG